MEPRPGLQAHMAFYPRRPILLFVFEKRLLSRPLILAAFANFTSDLQTCKELPKSPSFSSAHLLYLLPTATTSTAHKVLTSLVPKTNPELFAYSILAGGLAG